MPGFSQGQAWGPAACLCGSQELLPTHSSSLVTAHFKIISNVALPLPKGGDAVRQRLLIYRELLVTVPFKAPCPKEVAES